MFKVITLSAALETTRLRPESMINCGDGSINLFGRTIHDHSRYASLSMEDVLARSSNIGAINIGLTVGDKNLYEYIRRFGFGKKTGVPLPGESSGMVRPLQRLAEELHRFGRHGSRDRRDRAATGAGLFGDRERRISGEAAADAWIRPVAQPVRVLKPETAITMRRMMEGVVIKPYGTGHKYARLLGYTSAGKTGTAQIYDYRTHQYTHLYNASFMGFAPVTNPSDRGGGDDQRHRGHGGLWRPDLRPGVSRSGRRRRCESWTCPKICPRCFLPRAAIRPTKTMWRSPILVLPSLPRWSKREMPLPPTTDRWLPQIALWTSGLF